MDSKNQQLYRSIFFALLFILGTLASQAASRSLQEESMYERHEQWMTSFGRVYKDTAEKEERFKIFKANVEMIDSFNKASNKPYKLGVNQFADLTNKEFKLRNRFKSHVCTVAKRLFKYENVTAVPATMDWRKKGAVTPVIEEWRRWVKGFRRVWWFLFTVIYLFHNPHLTFEGIISHFLESSDHSSLPNSR